MAEPLAICFVAAEVTPFAKTGGLGDVSAALPRTLHRLGHDVRLFLPFYSRVDRDEHAIVPVDVLRDIPLDLGGRSYRFSVYSTDLPRSDLPLYLIHCPALFDRPEIYGGGEEEAIRFALLTRAAIESCQRMGFSPDVFHVNDWHTALLPIYLRTHYRWDELFARSKTVLTFDDVDYGLTFVGLFGLIDPPRDEAIAAVAECQAAGIQVKMITGDHAGTAVAIARQLGLENPDAILTGHDLDSIDDDESRGACRIPPYLHAQALGTSSAWYRRCKRKVRSSL